MPPVRKSTPRSLEQLCRQEIMNLIRQELRICQFIRCFGKTSLLLRCHSIQADFLQSQIANYLKRLPPLLSKSVRQEMSDMLMKSLDSNHTFSPPRTKYCAEQFPETREGCREVDMTMLNLVLNHEISSIEFTNDNRSYRNHIKSSSPIWSHILKCSGLKRLALTRRIFPRNRMALPNFPTLFVTRLTLGCPLLSELVIPNIVADSRPLRAIGQNCHFLQKLDISGSRNVKNQTILHLCIKQGPDGVLAQTSLQADDELVHVADNLTPLCHTLTALILTDTGVRAKGAGFLLRVMPNLTTLGDLEYTAAGLKNICKLLKVKKCKALALRHVYFKGSLNVKLKILARNCPNLESLYLGLGTGQGIHSSLNLNPLDFTKLTSLTLEDINTIDLGNMLQKTPNLLKLTVHCEHLDVSLVSKCCPKLEELCLAKEPNKYMRHLDQRCFQELYKVECHSPMSLEVAAVFFTHALKLRDVDLVRVRDLTDIKFMYWVLENPLEHLESLVIRYVQLTRESVDWLIANCDNLKKLGDLFGWDVSWWDCQQLKDLCIANNYDLAIKVHMSTPKTHVYDIFSDDSHDDNDSLW